MRLLDPRTEVYTGHDAGQFCDCVTDHNPNPMELHRHHILPLAEGGDSSEGNLVWLCPTSHVNVHELLRAWKQYEGIPPWYEDPATEFAGRYRYGHYCRRIAELGYYEMTA